MDRDLAVTTDFGAAVGEILVRHIGVNDLKPVFPSFDNNRAKFLGLIRSLFIDKKKKGLWNSRRVYSFTGKEEIIRRSRRRCRRRLLSSAAFRGLRG
ncbi:MAG TPA: hypothetical protein VEI73_13825 [Candidatus Acidoferrum sp.]|nr:hypothetical protein [Candidatus Acidoferrum sp.]